MTTHVDLYCRTCKVAGGLKRALGDGYVHRDDAADVVQAVHLLHQIPDELCGAVTLSISGVVVPLEWLKGHRGHWIGTQDEYGAVSGDG